MSKPRIAPLNPPYSPEVDESFKKIMPPGMEPLLIFRTFAHNPQILQRQMALGAALLTKGQVPHPEREVLLLRTCARCGAEYEWGVHVSAYARPLGFTDEQIVATVHGASDDPAWSPKESLLIRLADELHDTSTVSDGLWQALTEHWSDAQLLELMCVAGMYHGVSYVVNAARVELEPVGERFPVAVS